MKFLLFLLLVYLCYRQIKKWTVKKGPASNVGFGEDPGNADDVMLKDPVCGVYFPKRESVTATVRGERLYFCSEKCRDLYMENKG